MRRCARPGCPLEATATMTYEYGARTAWLDGLDPDALPSGYDLCGHHADDLRVPQGWTRTDRRGVSAALLRASAGRRSLHRTQPPSSAA